LSEREAGAECLKEAVEAARSALLEWTPQRDPLDRAAAHNNLAYALARMGALEEAVATYRTALQGLEHEHAPLQWAATQNNLGNALRALGSAGSKASSSLPEAVAHLQEAVQAYRAALHEFQRTRVLLDWAATQCNLAATLWILGERYTGTKHLAEAAEAYRAALSELKQDRVPLQWKAAQSCLDTLIQTIDEFQAGKTRMAGLPTSARALI
jgi:tetratricopeptide (TPR) repeat protein